ncbi:hypothetical protein GCM10011583_32210 [Streptomyces camponoticapitis]|uniref:Uncharacterized protein n=1 Tax=Streptomyces camponoticapitis TaxID=1616125 RepID=A0ABQ2E6M7_9ACTN|nr:hypothetical protein GCM10011583_32210 [Streptomyces camponoticapitis]
MGARMPPRGGPGETGFRPVPTVRRRTRNTAAPTTSRISARNTAPTVACRAGTMAPQPHAYAGAISDPSCAGSSAHTTSNARRAFRIRPDRRDPGHPAPCPPYPSHPPYPRFLAPSARRGAPTPQTARSRVRFLARRPDGPAPGPSPEVPALRSADGGVIGAFIGIWTKQG